MIAESLVHLPNVTIASFASLVVDLARQVGADVIIKGLRAASDFEAELQQAQMNKAVSGMETLFIPCASAHSFVASKFVRDFARFGGASRIASFVPEPVANRLKDKFAFAVLHFTRTTIQPFVKQNVDARFIALEMLIPDFACLLAMGA